MLRRIAIVGGNGFVGRHVVAAAEKRSVDAIGIVRTEEGARVVRDLGGAALLVPRLDEASVQPLTEALTGADGVVYTASVTNGVPRGDRTDPSGLQNLLEACRRASVPWIVYFSGLGIARYGFNPHCTNPYFLAKMAGEVEIFRHSGHPTALRPSYIFGPGDEFLTPLIRRLATDAAIEIPGEGEYRLQPIAVEDAAAVAIGALESNPSHPVVDLVGPEIVSYLELIRRVASIMGVKVAVRHRPVSQAIAIAEEKGYFGLRPNDLACLLCDEVSTPDSSVALAGRSLEPLDAILKRTVRTLLHPGESE